MNEQDGLAHKRMKTPRAAAIAGILFSVLLITSQLLIRLSIPADPLGPPEDVVSHSKAISLALNLLPFAGIAFLWFIAVVRDRLGALEDRFFATVFLGSGLLYIAMTFIAAAVAGGLIRVLGSAPDILRQTGAYALGRAEIYQTMSVYGIKMAGVFMFSTSTIILRTGIVLRWNGLLGYTLAAVLVLSIGAIEWVPLVFPLWVFLISAEILIRNLRGRSEAGGLAVS
ncbi:MAG TPA: hypothetical protein DEP35_12445 [Deltaproteobacteria bacterium]|nr:hypothetical protein [Deltaproteobacteria bacterium]